MIRKYESNILKLYLIKLAKWFMLIMPIVALFYTENGLSTFDIYLLQAIYSFSVALLEIPSGYMADIVGRKKSLVVGSILGTVGYIIYSFSHGFWGFMCAEIILGFGGSFISGSDSALLYDSLAAMRKQNKYLKLEGRTTSIGNFAETSAALIGGIVAAMVSYRAVYIAQTAIAFCAIPAALTLYEPQMFKSKIKPGFRHIIKISKYAVFENKQLSSALLFSSVIGTATLCMAWTSQIYFVNAHLTEKAITPLWIALNLLVAFGSLWAYEICNKLTYKKALVSIIFIIPLGYLWLAILPLRYAIATMFIFYAVRGYATPILKDIINSHCQSSIRATVLSIRSLIIRVGFAILGPFIGYTSGKISLNAAFILAFGIFAVFGVITAMFYFKNNSEYS